ncbi:MAG: sulfatase [Gemmatimonadetes bacterium]|nr:sulfatase [Gemmatimonadota bacterium]
MLCTRAVISFLFAPLALLAGLAPLHGCGKQGGSAPPAENAIVLLIDTVRFDEIGRRTAQGPVTPQIDRFSQGATRFQAATAHAPWTLPSVASLLTSAYPTVHGAVGLHPSFSKLRDAVPTGAEHLRSHGFETGAFVNCAFLDPALGLDRGFDDYDYLPASNRQLRRAPRTLDQALTWIDERSGRYFLFVHLFDAHMDFDPPEPFLTQFLTDIPRPAEPPFGDVARWRREAPTAEMAAFARALYRAEIAAVDAAIGDFLDALEQRGALANTAVVITSDHGEEFWEHGNFEHGHTLYDELLHVPLIVHAPGRDWEPTVEARVGLVDVLPTLCEVLGVPMNESFEGESLAPVARGAETLSPYRFAESVLYGYEKKAAMDSRFKYIYQDKDRVSLMYDLVIDPLERQSIAESDSTRRQLLASELLQWFQRSLARTEGSQRGEEVVDILEEDVVKKLRSLGYVN